MINDRRHVRAVDGWAPGVRDCAVRVYRIRSRKFDRPNIRTGHSYEEFSGETTISIKDEATDRNEAFSGSVETVATVQRGIGATFFILRLNPESEAKYNECYCQKSSSEGHVRAPVVGF